MNWNSQYGFPLNIAPVRMVVKESSEEHSKGGRDGEAKHFIALAFTRDLAFIARRRPRIVIQPKGSIRFESSCG
tara:strand:- start:2783 stop:3004 length:222 start_codon:yes stop_codon:yes gene_type:complete